MTYLFLDTNIFIHFVDFDQIDWKKIINVDDEIIIVLAPIVIDELDKHKYNKNKKTAGRVKKLLPKIETSIDYPDSLRHKLKILDNRPSENTFTENNLLKTEQDDSLLASIIEFAEKIVDNDKIFFITNDVGPRLKAKSLHIETLKLEDEYLLSTEPDETELKNIALRKELDEFKNRLPILKLYFKEKSNLATYKKGKVRVSKEQFIERELDAAKTETPYLIFHTRESLKKYPALQLAAFGPFSLTENQINEYNNELDRYYDEYRKYLEKAFTIFDFKNNSIQIDFLLNNSGTSPAEDIDIEIHFPDGFELYTEENQPNTGKKPSKPYRPKNSFDFGYSMGDSIGMPIIRPPLHFTPEPLNTNKPTIEKTNSYNVTYHIKNLKHNQQFKLETLYAKFEDITLAKGFEIEYKLIISNLPKPITGKLNINFID